MPYRDRARANAARRASYAKHRDEIQLRRRARYAADLETALRARARAKAHNAAHPELARARRRTYVIAHREEIRNSKRMLRYGVTREWVEEMLSAQEGQCAICEKSITASAHVDHNHVTGVARALLCPTCNNRLVALEDLDWLESAKTYLEVHAA